MYQHTVVSAAPACGVGVPIRSHVQALCDTHSRTNLRYYAPVPRSPGRAIATSPSLGREDSAVPWASSSARCWAPRGSTLLFRGQRDGQLDAGLAPPPPPQRRVRRARIALKPLKPHVSIRDDLGPQTAVCTHCKARHWECERSKSTRHFGACCSQGKVRLPPPPQPNLEYRQLLEGSDSDAKAFRENARSYNNALSFTSLAAHCWDQTQVDTLGPPVFRVFAFAQTSLIDPAEAANTRLQGPDSAETRIQRSTLTKLESMLRTGNCFVREFASAKGRAGWDTAKEWVLRLCLPPGRDRRTHNLPTSSTEMAMLICDSDTNTGDRGPQDLILQETIRAGRLRYQRAKWRHVGLNPKNQLRCCNRMRTVKSAILDRCPDGRLKYQVVSSLHPSAMPLRYPLLFLAGEDGFHPNIPLCGFHQAGPPIARNREQIDNGVKLREVLAGLNLDDEDEQEDEDRDNEDEDGEEGDEEDGDGEHDECFSIPHCNQRPFLEFVIYECTPKSRPIDSTHPVASREPTPHHDPRHQRLDPEPNRDITQRYQDAMACVVKHGKPPLLITMTYDPDSPEIKAALGPNDKACNRPDLIARVFEAKSGNKRHAGCFGDECKMNGFCFFAVFRIVFS
ncbi:BQ5605_C036g11507 [Microbotryum silenes-dioicae]|uniref:BQ5605_C036g11507 protein n=1 Tax=Microbotryum silenes-dioicae TaxID=796604 RepID=A0A2X0N243_9BASI|nr:BQ5605_C036g11507 [Microbotryum silenes-dioicae]